MFTPGSTRRPSHPDHSPEPGPNTRRREEGDMTIKLMVNSLGWYEALGQLGQDEPASG